jgi:hypothetical protein
MNRRDRRRTDHASAQDPGRVSALMPTLFLRFEAYFVVFKTEQPAQARSVYVTRVFVRPELEKTS